MSAPLGARGLRHSWRQLAPPSGSPAVGPARRPRRAEVFRGINSRVRFVNSQRGEVHSFTAGGFRFQEFGEFTKVVRTPQAGALQQALIGGHIHHLRVHKLHVAHVLGGAAHPVRRIKSN
eukprot:5120310-Pyramimonas_sp.AAC.1